MRARDVAPSWARRVVQQRQGQPPRLEVPEEAQRVHERQERCSAQEQELRQPPGRPLGRPEGA